MHKILVLHGVNLDMFGKRDPRHYGHATLADIDAALQGLAGELGVALETFQTNHEGVMVERIHAALTDGTQGALVDDVGKLCAGSARRHTRDGVELHIVAHTDFARMHAQDGLSALQVRQLDRHTASIAGFGVDSYLLGLRAACSLLERKDA